MHPYDILRLSRTTKALRGVLMSRSSRSIWMQAFLGIPGLPPCPSWLTEPQFSQLAFDNYCYVSCAYAWAQPFPADNPLAMWQGREARPLGIWGSYVPKMLQGQTVVSGLYGGMKRAHSGLPRFPHFRLPEDSLVSRELLNTVWNKGAISVVCAMMRLLRLCQPCVSTGRTLRKSNDLKRISRLSMPKTIQVQRQPTCKSEVPISRKSKRRAQRLLPAGQNLNFRAHSSFLFCVGIGRNKSTKTARRKL